MFVHRYVYIRRIHAYACVCEVRRSPYRAVRLDRNPHRYKHTNTQTHRRPPPPPSSLPSFIFPPAPAPPPPRRRSAVSPPPRPCPCIACPCVRNCGGCELRPMHACHPWLPSNGADSHHHHVRGVCAPRPSPLPPTSPNPIPSSTPHAPVRPQPNLARRALGYPHARRRGGGGHCFALLCCVCPWGRSMGGRWRAADG